MSLLGILTDSALKCCERGAIVLRIVHWLTEWIHMSLLGILTDSALKCCERGAIGDSFR